MKNNILMGLFICFTLQIAIAQETQVLYFGHVGYTAKINHDDAIENQSAFNTGGFDFFINSKINENLTVLGEFFMGFKGDGSTLVAFNIERLYFKYSVSQKFNLRLGRQYTPMGFWNNKYTQGIVFQPTINRPYPVRNANDKGILATNSVGLQIDGEDMGNMLFSYYLMIDNTTGAPSINTDNTTNKAITAKIKIEPVPDYQVFTSARYDLIEAGAESIQGVIQPNDVRQTIFNFGLAHMTVISPFELIIEYFHVINDVSGGATSNNNLGYGYIGYRINKITPYAELDLLEYDDTDTYFSQGVTTGAIVGARYNFNPSSVLKLEYKFRRSDALAHQDVISLQLSAVF